MSIILDRMEPKVAAIVAQFRNLPEEMTKRLGEAMIADMMANPPTADEIRIAAATCTDYGSFQHNLAERYVGFEKLVQKCLESGS